ncbi:MAG: Sir2 family NAD+-dependent deacetylase [Gammaproteobacteria bacterium WSBS_2016_MAG_OTU1]
MNKRIVALTGAGVSAESGLQTFRAADGLWENHRIDDVATPEGFARDPQLVHQFYNARRRQLAEVTPNAAHHTLADFEKNYDGDFFLVTQNIDDLHERAGSQNIAHMHGELKKMICQHCKQQSPINDDMTGEDKCPACHKSGGLRPDIVWFGEMPYHMEQIMDALAQCDLFISLGTSGNVYPAAGFVQQAHATGAECVELNLEPSAGAQHFNRAFYGKATEVVADFFATLQMPQNA